MKLNFLTKMLHRNVYVSLAILMNLTIISSCRRTVECPKSGGKINFIGYDATEVDTFKVYYYSKSTNFSNLTDSFIYTKIANDLEFFGDTCAFNFSPINSRNLTSADNSNSEIFDLKIINDYDNKTVELKDFTFNINFKKSGGFDPGTNHCQSQIQSFVQNGILISDNENIYINK